jgi:hypothetical protein
MDVGYTEVVQKRASRRSIFTGESAIVPEADFWILHCGLGGHGPNAISTEPTWSNDLT